MPKPYKLTRAYPLPADAVLVVEDGRPHVRMRDKGKAVLFKVSKDGRQYLKPSKRWYFDLRQASGKVKRVKGFPDLKATEQYANELERKEARKKSGYYDPAEEQVLRSLADHLKEYAGALEAKGGTLAHVRHTVGRIKAFLHGCGFVFPLDADAGKAVEWLNGLRRNGTPAIIPNGIEAFRPSEVAAVLNISWAALGKALERNNLPASGNGKARRIPREAVESLALVAARGVSPATVNHYIVAVRGFFRWLVKAKRIGSNPLECLTLQNVAGDIRRARRELTADELHRLFVAARDSERMFRGLTDTDRYFLYITAAGTGFRSNALANLTPTDFDLNSSSPTVTTAARFAKNRRTKVQPLPADVAEALRQYLNGKSANAAVWGGSWARNQKGAEMLRIDLNAANIAYAVEGPDGPEFADFHALRHSYLTLGSR